MPKNQKEDLQTNGKGKGTFRFRYMDTDRQFEVQADNVSGESLLEGFRHVANAISSRTIAATPGSHLLKKSAVAAASADAKVSKEKQEEFEFEAETANPASEAPAEDIREDVEEQEDNDGATGKKLRAAPRAPKF